MAKIECYDICWETDNQPVGLPTSVICYVDDEIATAPRDERDEILCDMLSEKYGWLVIVFKCKMLK